MWPDRADKARQASRCTSPSHLCVHWALITCWPGFGYWDTLNMKYPIVFRHFHPGTDSAEVNLLELALGKDHNVQHRGLGKALEGGQLLKVPNPEKCSGRWWCSIWGTPRYILKIYMNQTTCISINVSIHKNPSQEKMPVIIQSSYVYNYWFLLLNDGCGLGEILWHLPHWCSLRREDFGHIEGTTLNLFSSCADFFSAHFMICCSTILDIFWKVLQIDLISKCWG